MSKRAHVFQLACAAFFASWLGHAEAAIAQPITAEKLRPPTHILLDCKDAPNDAVTSLSAALARWATIYCTKSGHIFAYRDGYFASFPGSGTRAVISAAQFSGRRGEVGHEAYFTNIAYRALSPAEKADLKPEAGAEEMLRDRSKPLFQLTLTINSGQDVTMIVRDPETDPFWVFPVLDGKVGQAAFYIVSLASLNKKK